MSYERNANLPRSGSYRFINYRMFIVKAEYLQNRIHRLIYWMGILTKNILLINFTSGFLM
jgi:hypothetical protein